MKHPHCDRRWRRRVYACALTLLCAGALTQTAAAATAAAPEAVSAQRIPGLWTPGAANGLAYDAMTYRVLYNIPATRNVAVFRYELPNGEVRTLAIDSAKYTRGGGRHRGEGHSEERLDTILRRWGVDPGWVIELFSELEPCSLPGHSCKGMINRTYPKLRNTYWSLDYPYDRENQAQARQIRSQSMSQLKSEATDLRQRYTVSAPRTRLPVLTPHFMPKFPGGIDFSTLELRYVADTGSGKQRGLRYSFRGQPTDAVSDPALGLQNAGQASDALFAWLALPPETFWVNLHPSQPDRIIDPGLAQTDAGRVLLEADLTLKKSTVKYMNPDTEVGDRFWDELERIYGERAPWSCVSFRVWITPQPATVREDGDELFILDAPLTVNAQAMQVPHPDTGTGCPIETPEMEAAKENAIRQILMPHVIQEVNTLPEYAPLRRVYLSRVAAEWFRGRSATQQTALSPIVNSGEVERWAARTPWDPMHVFDRYIDSIRRGEWTAQREIRVGDRVYTRAMLQGGVDFSRTPRKPVARDEFESRWPGLAKRVRRSRETPVAGAQDAWLGGGSRSSAMGTVGLSLRTPDRRVSPGERVPYRLRVTNPTGTEMRGVRVCDRLPADLAFVRSNRRARVQAGWHCWEIARLAANRSTDIRIAARVLNDARGRAVSEATASVLDSANAARTRQSVRVAGAQQGRAVRPGGVTG